jgi:hypothetical protein
LAPRSHSVSRLGFVRQTGERRFHFDRWDDQVPDRLLLAMIVKLAAQLLTS